jgi:hypothetical protein
MLEIILLYFLCKSIGDVITNKGRISIGYQVMAVVMWFGGEFFAVFAYVFYLLVSGAEPNQVFDLSAWIVALCGGGLGGGFAYLIAQAMPPAPDPTMEQVMGGFGGTGALPAQADTSYDPVEEFSNLSTAKYMQNYPQG